MAVAMARSVIIICPCCASAVDAEAGDEPQEFQCVACGQSWSMVVDADRQATHAL